jgi:hypothetical protein
MSLQSQQGFKKLLQLVTQSSTDAPTAVTLENDFTGTLTWGYTSAGVYTLTASEPIFTANKTSVNVSAINGLVAAVVTSTTVLTFTIVNHANAATNALLTATPIEVKVYP